MNIKVAGSSSKTVNKNFMPLEKLLESLMACRFEENASAKK